MAALGRLLAVLSQSIWTDFWMTVQLSDLISEHNINVFISHSTLRCLTGAASVWLHQSSVYKVTTLAFSVTWTQRQIFASTDTLASKVFFNSRRFHESTGLKDLHGQQTGLQHDKDF